MIKYLQSNLGRGREAQDLLKQTAMEKKADVLIISEQYRKPETGSWFQDQTTRAAIAVLNPSLKIRKVGEPAANYVWVDIEGVRVYSCYFSPNDDYDDFISQLDDLEESLRTAHGEVLVAGDFNSKSPEWGSRKLDKRGEAVSEMIARMDLIVLNKGNAFTFRRGTTGSVIDITLASSGIAARTSAWRVLEDLSLSDHQYIEFSIETIPQRKTLNKTVKKGGWVLSKFDKARLEASLEEAKWKKELQRILKAEDLEKLVEYAVQTITVACDAAMPRRKSGPQARTPVHWWTPEISELRRKCLAARRKATRGNRREEDTNYELEYRNARKELRTAIKISKKKTWIELCRSVDEDPWGLPYKIVTKKLLGRQQIPGLSCPTRMSTIVTALFPTHERRTRIERQDVNTPVQTELFEIGELLEAGTQLQSGKSPGPDNIPNEIIRVVMEVWPELLLETFNSCLNKGVFHIRWKRQSLVLLRKGEKPLSEPSSYRPISLLDTIGKLFERMLLRRLEAHIAENGGLSPRQYGFRKGRSTVDAITRVIEAASKVKNGTRQSKGFCALITVDIANAFNTVMWSKIIEALKTRKTPEYLLRMIDSYLSNRILIYDTEDGLVEYDVTAGVPQGSVLGPFLWNVLYDGLLNLELPGESDLVGFADDVGVVVTARSTKILEVVANECLRRTSRWLKANGLKIAAHKTEAILITDRRLFTPPTLVLEGQVVHWAKSLRYLGVQLDSGLRYTEHVNKTAEKAATTAAALARLMPNIGGPRELKRKLLNSVVHSKILYASEVWAEATNRVGARQRLAAVQRRSALRVISGYRTVSAEATLVLASTPPIDLLVCERREIYEELKCDSETQKVESKKRARERLMDKWQTRWDSGETGRWTYRLIPKLAEWNGRAHGQMDYFLTQALTGHGCFNAYLERFKKTESAACLHCNHCPDDARHTIFECSASEEDRRNLQKIIGVNITEGSLIPVMLGCEENWRAVSDFITKTMKMKRRLEEADRAQKTQITTVTVSNSS